MNLLGVLLMAMVIGISCANVWAGSYKINNNGNAKNYIKGRTIVSGRMGISQLKKIKAVIKDYTESSAIDWRSRPVLESELLNGDFKFEINELQHPVYLKFSNAILGSYGTLFKGKPDVRIILTSGDYSMGGILIEPGDSIFIDLSAADSSVFTEAKFSGKGSEKLECFQNVIKGTRLYDAPYSPDNIHRYDLADSVTSMVLSKIDSFKSILSSAAYTLLKTELISMLTCDVSEYISGNMYMAGMKWSDSEVKKLYYRRLRQSEQIIDLTDSCLAYSSMYIESLIRKRAFLTYAIKTNLDYQSLTFRDEIRALDEFLPASGLKSRVMGMYIYGFLNGNNITSLDQFTPSIGKFLSETPADNYFHKKVLDKYNLLTGVLKKGAMAYNFALPDINGKIINMEDFRGKVVLIDFMYTGCMGCIQMARSLERLENTVYKGNKDVVFISISITADKMNSPGSWKKGIGIYSSNSSLQLCAGGDGTQESYMVGKNHPVIKHYDIGSYPTLILIDRQGKIISPRAPDPRLDNGKILNKLINNALSSPTVKYNQLKIAS